jgi:hypothetical protein
MYESSNIDNIDEWGKIIIDREELWKPLGSTRHRHHHPHSPPPPKKPDVAITTRNNGFPTADGQKIKIFTP